MPRETIHQESEFERYISRKIAGLQKKGGWRVSPTDDGFDASTALYLPDFLEFVEATAPEKVEKMRKNLRGAWEDDLRRMLVRSLETDGTIMTLRNGFPMAGYQTIACSAGRPDDPRVRNAERDYDANILRVMHQVHYQTAGNKSLDLVFFVNGIPVATAEVKTELTQTVQDAIEEYQTQRKPIEPGTNRKNYLLMYRRGAVVHFAISEDEIWMCTNLGGDKPRFLPFNRGRDGHAGNPPMKSGDSDYPTGYFWNLICQRDNWLALFQRFVFEEVSKEEDATGRLREKRVQIFPRYHQWDCITKLMAAVREEGPGGRYLIEHSAGSGKTETITWLAHELTNLRDGSGAKTFSSVVVVTDRLSLDSNIKGTIGQLKGTVGLIEMIGRDEAGSRTSNESKSHQLADALAEKREIVVVTIQTFLYAWPLVAKDARLGDCDFAVIVDEAHNSQEGTAAAALKTAFNVAGSRLEAVRSELPENGEDVTDEDVVNAFFARVQEDHVMPRNVSFFAFTATPKGETKTLFGTPSDRIDEKTGRPIMESFHLYPMRQAIEEGYIIDPLTGYLPYSTAYKLKESIVPDKLVDKAAAYRSIAKWKSLHPTNVMEKAEFVVEHFVKNVAALLEGQAKAMIVTSSRPAVVRYKYAIDAYLAAHPEYDRSKIAPHLQFKVPGEPLVAFSDKVPGARCIVPEDEYLEGNPFAAIRKDFDYTEQNMNGLGRETVENAFDRPTRRLLIVADKFQTGFDQPKLCALYIDKPIANDIEIVQTYSRVNRTFPGKDHVFIVDFVNDPRRVVNAFKKYDEGAEMEHAQSLEVIYDVKKWLDGAGIYTKDDFDAYKRARYGAIARLESEDRDKARRTVYRAVDVPTKRFSDARATTRTSHDTWAGYLGAAEKDGDEDAIVAAKREMTEAEEEMARLGEFRKKLKRYVSAYMFVSQIVDLGDPDLEVFHGFAKLLYHRIEGEDLGGIDVSSLVLSDYRINPIDMAEADKEASPLRTIGAGGRGKVPKQESMRRIVERLNEAWGDDTDPVSGARGVNFITDFAETDEVTHAQIANSTNSREAVLADGRLKSNIKMALVAMVSNDLAGLAAKAMEDPQAIDSLAEQVYENISHGKRYDIPAIREYLDGQAG